MTDLILATMLVLVASAACSMTEAALFSASIHRVRQRAEAGSSTARVLLAIRERMDGPITTLVILNNIANILGSLYVGALAAEKLGEAWLGAFSGGLTFLVVLFAEIVPKQLGERYAMPIGMLTARPVQLLTVLFVPAVWLVRLLTSPLRRGAPAPTTDEAEIRMLAHIGHNEGQIEQDESEMIQRVFRLNDTTAKALMTPRVSLTRLDGRETLRKARESILRSQHTRIVVCGESVDDVIGIVRKDDLLAALAADRFEETVASFARDPIFVPGSARADDLLATFRRTRQHLAVVVDEYGGLSGVVTLEDVLEVLTGEIVDETDRVVDLQEEARQRGRRNPGNQQRPEPA
ncbi:MAG: hemolysin family protein [Leptospirales bacterium]|nr:hemolysin family protein [Leptospirales bacterium]